MQLNVKAQEYILQACSCSGLFSIRSRVEEMKRNMAVTGSKDI